MNDEDQYTEEYTAEDGTIMLAFYTWNNEAGEYDYSGAVPKHWFTSEEEY